MYITHLTLCRYASKRVACFHILHKNVWTSGHAEQLLINAGNDIQLGIRDSYIAYLSHVKSRFAGCPV